jgi:hypothetical protein
MSRRNARFTRYQDEEGFRIPKHKARNTHADHLQEKRLQSALRSNHIADLIDDDIDDEDPHWMFRD